MLQLNETQGKKKGEHMKCAKCDRTATHYVNIVVETPERETDYIDGYACDYHAEPQIPVGFSVLESEITELTSGA